MIFITLKDVKCTSGDETYQLLYRVIRKLLVQSVSSFDTAKIETVPVDYVPFLEERWISLFFVNPFHFQIDKKGQGKYNGIIIYGLVRNNEKNY